MTALFAMRRANGDWFAFDDKGQYRVPVFHSPKAALHARSRDAGMECFRPVALDETALRNLITTDQGRACFSLVGDPSRKLSNGRFLDKAQLMQICNDPETITRSTK